MCFSCSFIEHQSNRCWEDNNAEISVSRIIKSLIGQFCVDMREV